MSDRASRGRAALVVSAPSAEIDLEQIWQDVARGAAQRSTSGAPGVERARARWESAWREADHRSVAVSDAVAVGLLAVALSEPGPWVDRARPGVVTAHITLLHVAEQGRRLGVGQALMGDAVDYADRAGAELLVVDVPPDLGRVNRFYARLGFAPVTTRRVAGVASLRRKFTGEPVTRRRLLRRRAGST